MKLYLSRYRQNAQNTQYETEVNITNLDQLKKAALRDHIAAKMQENHRRNENFLEADCIMLDLDNTHSDDPADWKGIDDISDTFPDVTFYYIYSRNHMKEKTKVASDGTVTRYEPRPKYHVYFPLQKTYTKSDYEEYDAIMLEAAALFPFFDLGAAKPAQFFYGVPEPDGGSEPGDTTLDAFMQQQPRESIIEAVREYSDKVKAGQYRQDKETDRALSRLYNYLGIPKEGKPLQQGNQTAADYTGGIDEEMYSPLGAEIAAMEQERSLAWFDSFAEKHGIETGKRYRITSREHPGAVVICVTCPWEDEHSMNGAENETVVIIDMGGKISFLCRHSHGGRYSWKDYRAFYESNTAQDQAAEVTTAEGSTGDALPGLLTYSEAVNIFQTADDRYLELKSFPAFSEAAKIQLHDSIVIAADTGVGKSSLAMNFLNDLNEEYPCIYFNLEMSAITVLRRLTAIYSGLLLDRIEGYRHDEQTAAAVNVALKTITSRKPLQIVQGAYLLQEIEKIIKQATADREEPTIVIIDHSLLVDTKERTGSRYDRFTQVSEGLRKIALSNNIILFVLLQQNRAGKASDDERPKNSSLKESGSWENDATHICFLWYDPTDRTKKLLLTKNRNGSGGEFALNYWKKIQTYKEASSAAAAIQTAGAGTPGKQTKRERTKQKLLSAYESAYLNTFGRSTLQAMAEAADVTTSTIKAWIKEYGGLIIDGKSVDPAGIDTIVEQQELVKLTPAEETPFDEPEATTGNTPATPTGQKKGRNR